MARTLRLLILQLVVILLVAVVSAYEIPDFTKVNDDIVLFLTPYGIAKNFLAAESPLRPFYFEVSPGQTQLTRLRVVCLGILYVVLLTNFVWISRSLKRRWLTR